MIGICLPFAFAETVVSAYWVQGVTLCWEFEGKALKVLRSVRRSLAVLGEFEGKALKVLRSVRQSLTVLEEFEGKALKVLRS